jgi:hypothetical protein
MRDGIGVNMRKTQGEAESRLCTDRSLAWITHSDYSPCATTISRTRDGVMRVMHSRVPSGHA